VNKETDRELLELAAKACWIEIEYTPASTVNRGGSLTKFDVVSWHGPYLKGTEDEWNPLTKDGDALQIVVLLEMHLEVSKWVITVYYGMDKFVQEDWHNEDPYIATRRAIVRAAAEIGRNLK